MEKEKSIKVSESTYQIIKQIAKNRMQSIKTVVKLMVQQFNGSKSK